MHFFVFFPRNSTTLFADADIDGDGVITQEEFRAWYRKHGNRPGIALIGEPTFGGEVPEITQDQMKQLALLSAIPMVGFGFVDNIIMVTAGDVIDAKLGLAFGVNSTRWRFPEHSNPCSLTSIALWTGDHDGSSRLGECSV